MKILWKFKKCIVSFKNERLIDKILKDYSKRKKLGVPISEAYECKISELMDYRIKNAFLKKEIRKKLWPVFYMDYLFAFVFTDKGQLLFRGSMFRGLLYSIKTNIQLSLQLSPLGGCVMRENPYIARKTVCCLGLKSAERKFGYSQEILLKSGEEILHG